jgi:predicted metal-dependent HD superfamily phosphohydrolase
MANSEIVKKTGDFVYELLKAKLPRNFVFHDYNHSLDVVKACKEIGKKSDLNEDEMEIVLLASWFHDVGYIEKYEGHEEKSAEIAEKFLKENNYPQDKIEQVKGCILATKYPQSPKNLLEEVVCDADLAHIAMDDYLDKSDLLRVEWEKCTNRTFSEVDWLKHEIDFFSRHKFFTKYAKKEFEENKIAHLLKIQKRYRKKLEQKQDDEQKAAKLEFEKEKLETKKGADKKADRGVETMFRNVVRTHVDFSAMADHKANIMLSLNTLIIGIIVTTLIRKLDEYPYLTVPTFILLSVALVCMVFAVLSTRPKVSAGIFTKDEIHQRKANLLFFGNFHKMGLPDFEWGMQEMMNDKEFLYESMIKDFYFLGQVLGRKYRYLRICYNIFMFGIIISVAAFAISFLIHPETSKIDLLQK